MKNYKLAFVVLLWSCTSFGSLTSTLVPVSPTEFPVNESETVIGNMPRVRSQDSLGVCFGFSSATVAQHYVCQQKKMPCNQLKESQELSPLAMVAWANPDDPNKRVGTWTNHSNIRFSGMGYGALGHFTLDSNNSIIPESCFPFDQFANKFGGDQQAVDALIAKLRNEYDKYKTEGSACEECLLHTVQNEFGAKTTAKDLALGLKQKTFEQFLFAAFLGSCDEEGIELSPSAKMHMFPEQGKTTDYGQLMTKIKDVLKTGSPMVLDAVCPFYENGKCTGGHSVVISGYRKVCKDKEKKNCREVLKIQNSWGEDWQKRNSDGWLDAKILIGDKPVGEGAISWLSKKQ